MYDELKNRLFDLTLLPNRITAQERSLPDFIIIGAQKAGTSSLYHYLCDHPRILKARRKEIHYFDLNFDKGINWYKSFFPKADFLLENKSLTGEASPFYLFHPEVTSRLKAIDKQIKFIVLLRDPVDRAYSHYYHNFKKKKETRTAHEALSPSNVIPGDSAYTHIKDYRRFSYLERGLYTEQLKRWFTFFPRDRFIIKKSESFYESSNDTLTDIFRFLDLPDYRINNSKIYLKNTYPEIDETLRKELKYYYKDEYLRLKNFLGIEFE